MTGGSPGVEILALGPRDVISLAQLARGCRSDTLLERIIDSVAQGEVILSLS